MSAAPTSSTNQRVRAASTVCGLTGKAQGKKKVNYLLLLTLFSCEHTVFIEGVSYTLRRIYAYNPPHLLILVCRWMSS